MLRRLDTAQNEQTEGKTNMRTDTDRQTDNCMDIEIAVVCSVYFA